MTDNTTPDTAAYASLLDRIIKTGGYTLPDGTNMWTIRTVHPDLRSSRDYRWPFPGQWATAPGPINTDNTDACPAAIGDGLCVATTWEGMASGGVPALTLLLCAINTADALSPVDADKIRVRRAYVVDVVDGAFAVHTHGVNADLHGANLEGANLSVTNLSGANLSVTNLSGACLYGANLVGASLSGADLEGAILDGANLTGATLSRASLLEADLEGADLSEVDLSGACLYGANLVGANLERADLSRADWDGTTRWPENYNPAEATK